MIAGHESVTSGDILLGDDHVTDLPPAKRGTAMMFQSYALFPHLDLRRQRRLQPEDAGVAKAERRAKALRACSSSSQMEPYAERAARRSSPAASSSASRWRAR